MKVLHIARGFGDYLIGLLNGVAELTTVHVALATADEWMLSSLNENVRVFRSEAPRVSNPANLVTLWSVAKYIRSLRPDIIHFQCGVIWELALARLFPATPIVVTIHDVTRHPNVHKLSQKLFQYPIDHAAGIADAIIVHGDQIKAAATARFEIPRAKAKFFSIPHGVIARYGSGIGRVNVAQGGNVLMFGSINRYKGVEYLVAAEPLIRARLPNVNICIAGSPASHSYHSELLASGQKIDLKLRRQADDEVTELFRWADVVVLPYIEASQSGVLQLAFSFGVPTVVTSVGGLPEVVIHEKNGLVVPPRDASALADAVIRMLSDTELRRRAIDNIVLDRESRFSWPQIARSTVDVYSECLESRNLKKSGRMQ